MIERPPSQPGRRAAVARALIAVMLLALLAAAGAARTAAATVTPADLAQLAGMADLRTIVTPMAAPPGTDALEVATGNGRLEIALPSARRDTARLWFVLTGRNATGARRVLALDLGRAGLARAGGLAMVLPPRLTDVTGSAGVRVLSRTARRAILDLPPGTFAIAFVSDGPLSRPLRLRPVESLLREERGLFGFAGVLGGMALLLVLALIMLQMLRPLPQLPAVLALACGALAHVLVTGGLAEAALPTGLVATVVPRMLMLGEGLMLFGLAVWLMIIWQRRQARAVSGEEETPGVMERGVRRLLPVLVAAVATWAVARPDTAALVLRLSWVLLLAGGLVLLAHIRRLYPDREDGTLITWGLMTLWSMAEAAVLAGVTPARAEVELSLAAALVVVLFSLVANMLRAALAPGDSLRRLLGDASRRALALTAADLAVWDVDAETGAVTV
ncbi:MAG TPA: hypothetical protein ENK13_04190, partial [Thermopetrobacter sp.]|nr:hypothetical protein [Thermopetrobacter sp.]